MGEFGCTVIVDIGGNGDVHAADADIAGGKAAGIIGIEEDQVTDGAGGDDGEGRLRLILSAVNKIGCSSRTHPVIVNSFIGVGAAVLVGPIGINGVDVRAGCEASCQDGDGVLYFNPAAHTDIPTAVRACEVDGLRCRIIGASDIQRTGQTTAGRDSR